MKNLEELTCRELIDNFLAGRYSSDTDECVEAINALHESLTSVEALIPLLLSNNRVCQEAATYIAAQEGDRACCIFPYVFQLLESPWVEVRDEVCDCFTECASKAEQLIALFQHLEDPEECIRLRVINALSCLKGFQVDMVFEHIQSKSGFDDIRQGVALLYQQNKEGVSFELLRSHMIEGTKLTKLFTYAVAVKEQVIQNINDLAHLSAQADILKHHEIYFCD